MAPCMSSQSPHGRPSSCKAPFSRNVSAAGCAVRMLWQADAWTTVQRSTAGCTARRPGRPVRGRRSGEWLRGRWPPGATILAGCCEGESSVSAPPLDRRRVGAAAVSAGAAAEGVGGGPSAVSAGGLLGCRSVSGGPPVSGARDATSGLKARRRGSSAGLPPPFMLCRVGSGADATSEKHTSTRTAGATSRRRTSTRTADETSRKLTSVRLTGP